MREDLAIAMSLVSQGLCRENVRHRHMHSDALYNEYALEGRPRHADCVVVKLIACIQIINLMLLFYAARGMTFSNHALCS